MLRRGVALIRQALQPPLVQCNPGQPLSFSLALLHAVTFPVAERKPGRGDRMPGVRCGREQLDSVWVRCTALARQRATLFELRLRQGAVDGDGRRRQRPAILIHYTQRRATSHIWRFKSTTNKYLLRTCTHEPHQVTAAPVACWRAVLKTAPQRSGSAPSARCPEKRTAATPTLSCPYGSTNRGCCATGACRCPGSWHGTRAQDWASAQSSACRHPSHRTRS